MKNSHLFVLTLIFMLLSVDTFAQINRTKNRTRTSSTTEKSKSTLSPNEAKDNIKKEEEQVIKYNDLKVIHTIDLKTPSKTKLKVTLLELQSAATQNGELAHLSINQHVQYQSKGKYLKPVSRDVKKIKNNATECPLGYLDLEPGFGEIKAPRLLPDDPNEWNSTPLICGNRQNQIHVNKTEHPLTRNPNINHSLVFELTDDQVNDKNAKFTFDTFVVEYSTDWKGKDTSIELLHDSRKMSVAIHDVLSILLGKKKLNANQSYVKDGSVPAQFKFDHFDGISLPLRNVNPNGKIILEGPIRARNKGNKLIEKAFVWMRFELVD